ncbi:hypothetical protein MTO96_000026 [Rhipicephalus appendiculatus]
MRASRGRFQWAWWHASNEHASTQFVSSRPAAYPGLLFARPVLVRGQLVALRGVPVPWPAAPCPRGVYDAERLPVGTSKPGGPFCEQSTATTLRPASATASVSR